MAKSKSATGAAGSMIDSPAGSAEHDACSVEGEVLLSLLSDDYARSFLSALAEQPLAARELVDRLDVSRPTVYRRLDRLESAGIVESSIAIHPDGHHRKEFRIAVEGLQFDFGADGITVEITA